MDRYFARRDEPNIVRRIYATTPTGVMYREYWPNNQTAFHGSCQLQRMRVWGVEITAAEARERLPNMDAQDEAKDAEENAVGERLMRASLMLVSDDELAAECERRGWTVQR